MPNTLASALASSDRLPNYQGRDVLRTSIAIRNAGDGLSQAMGINPVELEIGSKVFVVLECEVVHHDHGPIKDTDCLELKQVLRAGTATLVDEDLVREHLDQQAERIRVAEEAARGVQRFDFEPTDTTEAMILQHNTGVHEDEPRDDCPLCEEAKQSAGEGDDNNPPSTATPISKARGKRGSTTRSRSRKPATDE